MADDTRPPADGGAAAPSRAKRADSPTGRYLPRDGAEPTREEREAAAARRKTRGEPPSGPYGRSAATPAASETGTRRRPPDARGARLATFSGSSYDAEARTVEAVLSAGARVRRWFGFEELDMSPAAVDVSRVDRGLCRLLDHHNQFEMDAVLGAVESVRFEGETLIGRLRFADTDRGRQAEGMVSRGELTGVSIGYGVRSWRLVEIDDQDREVWRAAEWELFEASLVAVPADPNAGVRSAAPLPGAPQNALEEDDDVHTRSLTAGASAAVLAAAATDPASGGTVATPETRAAPAATPAAIEANPVRFDTATALDFVEDCRALGVTVEQARTWATTLTPDAARTELVRAASAQQRARTPTPAGQSQISVLVDERDTARSAMTEALLHRFRPRNEISDAAREYRGMSLLEMGRENLIRNGDRGARGLSRMELAERLLSRTHSTSDFPNVLGNVANRTLRDGYAAAPRTFTTWMRRATVPDFRPVTRLQMGGAPSFLLVPEGGQFKMGTIGEGKEVYAIATYGRRFAITRQVLVNDDLDAFTRIPEMWGRAAADFESDTAYAPLIANPTMGDGNALFSSAHGNLAGSGAAIGETTVQAGELAMGAQTGIEGRVTNIAPRYLITARKDALPARKLLTAVQATATSGVNVYAGQFELIVDSRLNRAAGATPWFMAADSAQVDTIEYAYLEGEEGVFLDERTGFEVDGMEFKARLDFGVKAIDWRGLYQNPGT